MFVNLKIFKLFTGVIDIPIAEGSVNGKHRVGLFIM